MRAGERTRGGATIRKPPDAGPAQDGAPAPGRERRQIRRLKWLIVGSLATFEFTFDLWIEPWLRSATLVEESIERLMAVVEVAALAVIVISAFNWLERSQQELQGRREELERLYREAHEWDEQLQALHEASVAMAREGSYPEVLGQIVALAAQLSRARYGALAEFDAAQNVVEFVTFGVPEGVREEIALPPSHRGLLRKISRVGPVRIDDVVQDADFTGFPKGHPGFRTFLGVPIRWEGALLGHLYLGGHQGEQPFSEAEDRLLEMFAMQAAVVIARARLLREVARTARHVEREQISMRLHDEALQSLYALGLGLDQARRRGLKMLTDTMSVDVAVEAIQQSMRAIRGVLEAFDREVQKSVQEGIRQPAEHMASFYGLTVRWQGIEEPLGVTEQVAAEIGSCLAEAVANAARHGRAHTLTVRIQVDRAQLQVSAADDGRGLAGELAEGRGLQNIHRRMESLGGSASLGVGARRGCALVLRVPLGG